MWWLIEKVLYRFRDREFAQVCQEMDELEAAMARMVARAESNGLMPDADCVARCNADFKRPGISIEG